MTRNPIHLISAGLLSSIFMVLACLVGNKLMASAPGDGNSIFVTLKVEQITESQLQAIELEVGRTLHIDLEYKCLESGVIILHIEESSMTERADVQVFVRNKLSGIVPVGAITFLDIHIRSLATQGRC